MTDQIGMLFKGFDSASGGDDLSAAIHKVPEDFFVLADKITESLLIFRHGNKDIAVVENSIIHIGDDLHIQIGMAVKFKHPGDPRLAFGISDIKRDPHRAVILFRELLNDLSAGDSVNHTVENTVVGNVDFRVETGGNDPAFAVIAEQYRRMVGKVIMRNYKTLKLISNGSLLHFLCL